VAGSVDFKVRQRRCLFLGLSDGARIDQFRRANQGDLSHEQIYQTYEISDDRVDQLLKKLHTDLAGMRGEQVVPEHLRTFRTIVVIDDFSASGMSYLRRETDGNFKGKIGKLFQSFAKASSPASRLIDRQHLEIIVALYMATEQARAAIEGTTPALCEAFGQPATWHVVAVYPLGEDVSLRAGDGDPMHALINTYYDDVIHDEHLQVGGTADSKYGFAACGLPLVLSHNSPNNSVALLWSYEETNVRGLFPRVRRHVTSGAVGP
jgi:hypothetical protein